MRRSAVLVALALLSGCAPTAPLSPTANANLGGAGGALSGLGGVVLLNAHIRGQVIGADGAPAAGVPVKGTLFVASNSSRERTLQALDATTDAEGRFELPAGPNDVAVVEAAQPGGLKAIRQAVRAADGDLRLQLAPTGTIAGQVTAAGVSDLTGVDVYIPGTGYLAKTDATGRFELTDVPAGEFVLVASKAGPGQGSLGGVRVKPRERTDAQNLTLHANAAVVTAVVPPIVAPGMQVEVRGQHFGAAEGAPIQVTLGGVALGDVQRNSDEALTATIPAGATSGDLVVTVGGVPGGALPVGVVAKLIPLPGRDALLVGETVPLVAAGLDKDGHLLGDVAAAWRAKGDALAVADGRASAKAEGVATLASGMGAVTAQLDLPVRRTAGELVGLYDAAGGSPDRAAIVSLARGADGTLYFVERGRDDGPAHVMKLDPRQGATTLQTPAGQQEPREVAAGPHGEVYALLADGSIWQLGDAPKRVLDPATLTSLLANTVQPPPPPGTPTASLPMPDTPFPAGGSGPKPRQLHCDGQGRLVFQFVPAQAVRFAPGEAPKAFGFAKPVQPGQQAPAFQLATHGPDLWAFLPRPNLAAALELVTETPPGKLTELTRDVGEVAGLAVDGQTRAYLAIPSRHQILEVAPDGTPRTVVGNADGNAPDPAREALTAPRQLLVDEGGSALWVVDGPNGSHLRRITLRRAP